jgi:phosphatidylinositol alpha-1,6-mannosyltransferase
MAMFPEVVVEPCELGLEELALPPAGKENCRVLSDAFGKPQELGKRFVLIVSRLATGERYKGHDQLIAVMPSLVEELADAQLVIAGDGDDRDRLQALARKTGAGQSILFSGFVSSGLLTELFCRCRVFAMPSRGEGFGLVYLEAMRFAKPCVASRVDGGSEVVADGVTGLLVNPMDLQDVREAVARLLTDEELAEGLGRAGRARLDEHYRFRDFQRRLLQRLAAVVPELAAVDPYPELDISAKAVVD